jgi:type I restriction enzyme, S subunit
MSELPGGWAAAPLADLGGWSGGGTPSKSKPEFWTDGTIPWVSPKDMKVDLIGDTEDHITEAAVSASATNIVPTGSVLIVTRSGILRRTLPVAVTAAPVALNQDLKALKPATGIDPRYVAWGLRMDEQSILHDCAKDGTTVDSIDFPEFLRHVLPLAPSGEQGRIVAAIEEQLSRADAGAAALRRVHKNLNRMRAAVLQCAIDGRLVGDDGSRWDRVSLPELGGLDRGKSRHRPRNDPALFGGPYPFIQTGDVALADPWITESSQTYNDRGLEQSRLWPKGTLCITIAANIAKTGLLTFDACFPDSVVGFTAASGETDARWVELVVRSMRDRLDQLAPATAQKNINLAILRALQIPYPDQDCRAKVIREYDRQMTLISVLEETVRIAVRRSLRLRSSVLAAAFTGKLVPQDSSEEPAPVLLERITSHRSTAADGDRSNNRALRMKVTA